MTLKLETTVPAFAGSAATRQVDPWFGVRPSAIRGGLRWWFRAAAAGVLRPEGAPPREAALKEVVARIRRAETELFGATERASRVVVGPPRGGSMREVPPFDPRSKGGVRYLGFGLWDDKGARVPEAWWSPRQDPLVVPVRLRDGAPAGAREALAASIWLWAHYGGLGAKTRRGFGSLHLREDSELPWSGPPLGRASGVSELMKRLLAGLDVASEALRRYLRNATDWDGRAGKAPHPRIRSIDGIDSLRALPLVYLDWTSALDHAGRLYRAFRSTVERQHLGMAPLPDYFAVKGSLTGGGAPRTVDRAAFGLPLPFYFRSLGGAKTRFEPDEQDGDRLASPLLFRVHPVRRQGPGGGWEDRLAVVLVNLAQRDPGDALLGCRLRQDRPPNRGLAAPGGTIIEQFIAWARDHATQVGAPGGER